MRKPNWWSSLKNLLTRRPRWFFLVGLALSVFGTGLQVLLWRFYVGCFVGYPTYDCNMIPEQSPFPADLYALVAFVQGLGLVLVSLTVHLPEMRAGEKPALFFALSGLFAHVLLGLATFLEFVSLYDAPGAIVRGGAILMFAVVAEALTIALILMPYVSRVRRSRISAIRH